MTWRLVIDTATRRTIVAVGRERTPAAVVAHDTPGRRGSRLMSQLSEVLAGAGIGMGDITAIGVGTGPGSFTGLRVGLATAKTLAAIRQLPLVGVPTDTALRRAAASHDPGTDATDAVVVLPAGARDHYLGMPGASPVLMPPGADLFAAIGARPVIAVDIEEDAPWLAPLTLAASDAGRPGPVELGRAASDGLPLALLELLDEALTHGAVADIATLVPSYVALPRGIPAATAGAADSVDAILAGEGTW